MNENQFKPVSTEGIAGEIRLDQASATLPKDETELEIDEIIDTLAPKTDLGPKKDTVTVVDLAEAETNMEKTKVEGGDEALTEAIAERELDMDVTRALEQTPREKQSKEGYNPYAGVKAAKGYERPTGEENVVSLKKPGEPKEATGTNGH